MTMVYISRHLTITNFNYKTKNRQTQFRVEARKYKLRPGQFGARAVKYKLGPGARAGPKARARAGDRKIQIPYFTMKILLKLLYAYIDFCH